MTNDRLALSVLTVSPEQLTQIRQHAERVYPEECCGLLLGKITDRGDKNLLEVWETENSWSREEAEYLTEIEGEESKNQSKHNRFSIAPETMFKAQKEARDRSLAIIGIYHSHPDNPAIPSECDRRIAWSEYSYIIVAVDRGKAVQLQSFTLDEKHQFQLERMRAIADGEGR